MLFFFFVAFSVLVLVVCLSMVDISVLVACDIRNGPGTLCDIVGDRCSLDARGILETNGF